MPRREWAGSPADSWSTAPRPNAPSPWPSSSAASTPPRPNWAPPGRHCAKPSPATGSACPPAIPRRSASEPPQRPTSLAGHATDGLDARDAQPRPAAAPRGPQPEQGARLRRAEEIENLSYRTIVALNQESRFAPRWRIATIARRAERAPAPDRRPHRACRTPPGRACRPDRPQQPSPPPARGAGGCSSTPPSSTTHSYRGRRIAHSSSISGFSTRACFRRIAPATWANDVPLETVANRSIPMECGPNVDQASRPRPNGLRPDARIGGTALLTTVGGVQGMYLPVICRRCPVAVGRHGWPHAGRSSRPAH
jgi:hypothetical protein